MKNLEFSFLAALAFACAAGYGCGNEVISSGSTGTGGSSTSSGDGGSTQDGVVSSSGVGGAGTGGAGVTAVSSSSNSSSSSSGSSTSSGGPGSGAVLAVKKFYYGDTNFDDTPNKATGWKQYGFNLDGKVSTAASVDLCKPQANAPPNQAYPDGNSGIDNSFGRNILPIFLSLTSDFSVKANQSIDAGDYTLMFDLEGLGAMADQAPLVGKVYSGTPLGAAPKFDGSDLWPVAPEGLTNPADIASAKPVFPMSALVANHWDSGPTGATVRLHINVAGSPMQLDILGAHVAMDLDPDHQGAQMGQIGGVIATSQLIAEMKRVAGSIDSSLCSGPTVESIAAQLAQASDILADGTQDPTKTCDGISIGLGFKARAVSLGGIGPAAPPQPDPCGP